MERITFIFNDKPYKAVRFSGKSVGIEEIILAENALNEVVSDILENGSYGNNVLFDEAYSVDSDIFGFGDLELIDNGSLDDLVNYAKLLL